MKKLIVACLFSALSCATVANVDPPPPAFELDDHHSNTYEWFLIEGFWMQVRYPTSMDTEELQYYTRTILRLRHQLQKARALLPPAAVAKLQTTVNFFLKDDCSAGEVGYWRNREVQNSRSWIIVECFEFTSSLLRSGVRSGAILDGRRIWSNQSLLIQELARAWHDRFMIDGEDNDTIKAFYRHAKQCYGNPDEPYAWEQDETTFFRDFSAMYFLVHWDSPLTLYKMPYSFNELIRRSWTNEYDCTDCESNLGECVEL